MQYKILLSNIDRIYVRNGEILPILQGSVSNILRPHLTYEKFIDYMNFISRKANEKIVIYCEYETDFMGGCMNDKMYMLHIYRVYISYDDYDSMLEIAKEQETCENWRAPKKRVYSNILVVDSTIDVILE